MVSVNSQALKIAGVTRDTPDPAGGVIVRDASGEPTGVLLEAAAQLVRAHLPAPPAIAEQRRLLLAQMAAHNALGITSVTEPGISPANYELYASLRQQLTVRAHLLLRVTSLADVETMVEAFPGKSGDDMLSLDGFKSYADGGVEGGYLYQPYQVIPGEQTNPGYRGTLRLPAGGEDELARMYVTAARHKFQFQTHVVGDAAFDIVVSALRKANDEIRLAPYRFALMHLFLPSHAGMKTMKRMGILATVQDHPVLLGDNMVKWWGRERAGRGIPVRDLIDAGLVVAGGTDAPVVPPSPLWSLGWMTTRKTLQDEILGAGQAITPAEALHLYTAGSAYTQFAEHSVGTLTPGKRADLVVLDGNPLTCRRDEIRDIKVQETMVDGRTVYSL
ncbi:amidohydrolase [Kibdelosporangium philippinense]|uniref:amidohydrolase n=1 Tax=Kibdelosporangium philippinense TaxID=211113 RepID=UPI0035E91133